MRLSKQVAVMTALIVGAIAVVLPTQQEDYEMSNVARHMERDSVAAILPMLLQSRQDPNIPKCPDFQFRCYGPMVEQRYIEPVFKKVLKAVPSCKLNNPKPRNLTFSANGYAAKIRLGSDCGFGVDVPWDEAVARNALAFSSHWCYNKFNPRDPVPEGKFVLSGIWSPCDGTFFGIGGKDVSWENPIPPGDQLLSALPVAASLDDTTKQSNEVPCGGLGEKWYTSCRKGDDKSAHVQDAKIAIRNLCDTVRSCYPGQDNYSGIKHKNMTGHGEGTVAKINLGDQCGNGTWTGIDTCVDHFEKFVNKRCKGDAGADQYPYGMSEAQCDGTKIWLMSKADDARDTYPNRHN